jgi:hypothetical protein
VAEFYSSKVSEQWTVQGSVLEELALVPTCTAETKNPNGSYFHLSKDIDENLYYLWVRNVEWNLEDKEIVVRVDFYDEKGSLSYASLRAIVQKKNSLDVPIDDPKAFLERFMLSKKIRFTVSNHDSKFNIAVDKPIEIASGLFKCIDAWEAAKERFVARKKDDSQLQKTPGLKR